MQVPMVNNLKFSRVDYRTSMNKIYAFVTCIDVGMNGKGKTKARYWGEVSARDNANEIENVIGYGSKWDKLPC